MTQTMSLKKQDLRILVNIKKKLCNYKTLHKIVTR